MSHYQNKKARKYVITILLAIMVLAIVTGMVAARLQKQNQQNENQVVAKLLLIAKEQDKDWEHTVSQYANVLNGKSEWDDEQLSELEQELLQYGIKEEYIYRTGEEKAKQIGAYVCVTLVCGIVLLGLFWLYLRGRKNRCVSWKTTWIVW